MTLQYVLDTLNECIRVISEPTKNLPRADQVNDKKNKLPENICRWCKKTANVFKCLRCGDPYCSESCQKLDWPQHRHSCNAMPPLLSTENSHLTLAKTCENCKNLQAQHKSLACIFESLAQHLNKNAALTKSNDFTNVPRPFPLPLPSPFPSPAKMQDKVYLACIATLNSVYVYPENSFNAYHNVLRRVHEYGEKASALGYVPEVNTFVLAQRIVKNRPQFCRARILKNDDPNSIRLYFVDFGNIQHRKLQDLRISMDIADLPVYVGRIKLANVNYVILDPIVWRNILNSHENGLYYMTITQNDDAILVDAFTYQNLNSTLAFFSIHNAKMPGNIMHEPQFDCKNLVDDNDPTQSNAARKTENETVKFEKVVESKFEMISKEIPSNRIEIAPVMIAPFDFKIISCAERNEKAAILYAGMIEEGFIACILLKHLKEFCNVQKYLDAKTFDTDAPYVPQIGEYVIAQFTDKKWYRGQVESFSSKENKFNINYIDFMNEDFVDSGKIRPYPLDLTIAVHTQLCKIAGLPKVLTPEIKKILKKEFHVMDKILIDRVVAVDDIIIEIECNEILDRLLKAELL